MNSIYSIINDCEKCSKIEFCEKCLKSIILSYFIQKTEGDGDWCNETEERSEDTDENKSKLTDFVVSDTHESYLELKEEEDDENKTTSGYNSS